MGPAHRDHPRRAALSDAGVGQGDTVAVIAPNVPALLEAHYAVPGLRAVLCPINTRLDAATIALILRQPEAERRDHPS